MTAPTLREIVEVTLRNRGIAASAEAADNIMAQVGDAKGEALLDIVEREIIALEASLAGDGA